MVGKRMDSVESEMAGAIIHDVDAGTVGRMERPLISARSFLFISTLRGADRLFHIPCKWKAVRQY